MALMLWLRVVVAALAGLTLGWIAWLAAQRLIAERQPVSEPGQLQSLRRRPQVAVLAAMALWGAYVGWQAPGLPQATSALVVTALLLAITLVDFQVRRIPNAFAFALLVWALIQALWLGSPTPAMAALGLVVGGGVFLLVAFAGRGALGMGDVKLETAIGALVGYPAVLGAMFLGVLFGALAALILLLTGRVTRKTPIAYGPYLALGAWLVFIRLLGLWPGG